MKKAALLALVLSGSGFAAGAADWSHLGNEYRVLRVSLTMNGTENWQQGADNEKGTLSLAVSFATVLRPLPELNTVNVLDPDYAQKMMAKSAQVQQKVQAVQQRQAGAGNAPAKSIPQDQMMAMAMKIQQTCKGDEACMKREAMKMMPQAMAQNGMALPPGAMEQAGKQGDDDADDEKQRYQDWNGYEGCASFIRAKIQHSSSGALSDVGGMRPITRSLSGELAGLTPMAQNLCLGYQSVLDTDTKMVYRHPFGMPMIPGHSRIVHGPALEGPAEITLPAEVAEWVRKTLTISPLSGSKTEQITLKQPYLVSPYANSKYQGSVKVSLTWSFTDKVTAGTKGPDLKVQ
jgi:hypothetical protein